MTVIKMSVQILQLLIIGGIVALLFFGVFVKTDVKYEVSDSTANAFETLPKNQYDRSNDGDGSEDIIDIVNEAFGPDARENLDKLNLKRALTDIDETFDAMLEALRNNIGKCIEDVKAQIDQHLKNSEPRVRTLKAVKRIEDTVKSLPNTTSQRLNKTVKDYKNARSVINSVSDLQTLVKKYSPIFKSILTDLQRECSDLVLDLLKIIQRNTSKPTPSVSVDLNALNVRPVVNDPLNVTPVANDPLNVTPVANDPLNVTPVANDPLNSPSSFDNFMDQPPTYIDPEPDDYWKRTLEQDRLDNYFQQQRIKEDAQADAQAALDRAEQDRNLLAVYGQQLEDSAMWGPSTDLDRTSDVWIPPPMDTIMSSFTNVPIRTAPSHAMTPFEDWPERQLTPEQKAENRRKVEENERKWYPNRFENHDDCHKNMFGCTLPHSHSKNLTFSDLLDDNE